MLLLEHLGARLHEDGLPSAAGGAEDPDKKQSAERLVDELQALGPTFVKLGQLLSTRSDMLAPEYTSALARLRDKVEPMAAGEAERIVAEELGVTVSRAFGSFEAKPVGSASLGQVHRATLRDGRAVAVKVQRAGVRTAVAEDMEVISELVDWLDAHSSTVQRYGLRGMVARFRQSLMAELDYRAEAANLRVVGAQIERYDRLLIPQPIDDYCTSTVLTMDYVPGRSVGALSPLVLAEVDGAPLARDLFGAYLDQVLVHGLFHADPHPGNVILTPDHRLALVDFGQVEHLAPDTRENLLRLLLAVAEGSSPQAADALEQLGEPLEDFDRAALRARVADVVMPIQGARIEDVQIGRAIGDLARAGVDSGLRPPAQLSLVAKAMLNLDEIAERLDPGFVPGDAVRAHAAHIMRHRMLEAASPGRMLAGALDAKQFLENLPNRLNKVIDALAEGSFTVNVEGVDEAELMRGVQKLANRGATGVVIAALVLAAAIFASAKVGPRVWGYPLPTIVLLALALLASIWLVVGIVRSDLPQRKRRELR